MCFVFYAWAFDVMTFRDVSRDYLGIAVLSGQLGGRPAILQTSNNIRRHNEV